MDPDRRSVIEGYELAQGPGRFHVALTLRLEGELDVARLERALELTSARHDALRARHAPREGNPYRLELAAPGTIALPVEDVAPAELDSALAAALGARLQLASGCTRARLLRTDANTHVFMLVLHRSVCDEASLDMLHRDLLLAYAGTPLAAPTEALARGASVDAVAVEAARERATAELAGDLPVLELSCDRSRPMSPSGSGRTLWHTLDRDVLERVDAFASSEGASRDDVLLLALLAWAQRCGAGEDVVFGLTAPDPVERAHEGVGPWTRACVMRATVPLATPVREALRIVARAAARARANAALPFRALVAALDQPYDSSRTPLYQVAFAGEVAHAAPATIAGVTISRVAQDGACAATDLTLRSLPVAAGLRIGLTYAADLWDEPRATAILDALNRALCAALERADDPLGRLPVLSEAEQGAAICVGREHPHDTRLHAHVRFERWAKDTPDAPAVVMNGETYRYAELNRHANRLARALVAAGVVRETLVGIYCERSLDMLVAVLAVLKSGGAYVPLDPLHPRARIATILEDAAPRVIITQQPLAAECPQRPDTTLVLCDDPALLDQQHADLELEIEPNALAYVIFTSGSTGRPKGVEIEQHSLTNFLASMAHTPGCSERDRILSVTTLSFDIAGLELLLPLTVGGSLEIADSMCCVDPSQLGKRLADPAISVLQATPANFRMLVDSGWRGRRDLRVLCGGEALPPDLLRQLLERVGEVWNMYGPTETTVWSSVQRLQSAEPPVSIGSPIDNTMVYVLTTLREPVAPGAIGEIYIGGDGVARGYRARPSLTAERFVSDPFSTRENARMYRTGDFGRVLPDGSLACLGRVDFQVKIRGFRIELGEVENALLACEHITQAVVIAREDSAGDKRLVGYVVAPGTVNSDLSHTLRAHMEGQLPSYMVPSTFVRLESLPLNPAGKIDRKALPAPIVAFRPSGPSPVLSDDIEATLHSLFAQALGVAQLPIDESFFDAGGDSLSAVRLVRKIEQALSTPVALATLFESPTIRGLAAVLRQEYKPSEEPRVVMLKRGTGDRIVFCVYGVALYQHLARGLPVDTTVYGIFVPWEARLFQTENLKRGVIDFPAVEALAQAYVRAIRNVQPTGPYNVLGFSFGGIVAYEIAQQLSAHDRIGMLALLDSQLPALFDPHPVRRALRSMRRFVQETPYRGLWSKVWRARAFGEDQGGWSPAELEVLRDAANEMEAERYSRQMQPYDHDVVLVTAVGNESHNGHDPNLAWRSMIRGRIVTMSAEANHLGILEPPLVSDLARKLSRHLPVARASGPRSAPPAQEPPSY